MTGGWRRDERDVRDVRDRDGGPWRRDRGIVIN